MNTVKDEIPETPEEMYNQARAGIQEGHRYRTRNGEAFCNCGVLDTESLIGDHIEVAAEYAGIEARDAAVLLLAAQTKIKEKK